MDECEMWQLKNIVIKELYITEFQTIICFQRNDGKSKLRDVHGTRLNVNVAQWII